jgi:hypothetical protein
MKFACGKQHEWHRAKPRMRHLSLEPASAIFADKVHRFHWRLVAIPCLWLEAMEMAVPWHGRPISGRIGCQTPSSEPGYKRLWIQALGWLTRS